jgi:hypothetical protein
VKNKMSDLRNHLFETLEALKDRDNPMEIERARAISDVAQTLINTAKVEVQFLDAIGAEPSSEFFDVSEEERGRAELRRSELSRSRGLSLPPVGQRRLA